MRHGLLYPLLVVFVALLACAKTDVKGKVSVDGEPFSIDACRVGALTVHGGRVESTDRFLMLLDGKGRQIQIHDDGKGKLSLDYTPGAGSRTTFVGSECGSVTMEGNPSEDPKGVRGNVHASCKGDGHAINVDIDYSRCEAWTLPTPRH